MCAGGDHPVGAVPAHAVCPACLLQSKSAQILRHATHLRNFSTYLMILILILSLDISANPPLNVHLCHSSQSSEATTDSSTCLEAEGEAYCICMKALFVAVHDRNILV